MSNLLVYTEVSKHTAIISEATSLLACVSSHRLPPSSNLNSSSYASFPSFCLCLLSSPSSPSSSSFSCLSCQGFGEAI